MEIECAPAPSSPQPILPPYPTPLTTRSPGGEGRLGSCSPALNPNLQPKSLLAARWTPPPRLTSGCLALPAQHPHPPILAVWHPLSSHPWGSWQGPSLANVVMSLAVPRERSSWACCQSVNPGPCARLGNLTQALERGDAGSVGKEPWDVGSVGKLPKSWALGCSDLPGPVQKGGWAYSGQCTFLVQEDQSEGSYVPTQLPGEENSFRVY